MHSEMEGLSLHENVYLLRVINEIRIAFSCDIGSTLNSIH